MIEVTITRWPHVLLRHNTFLDMAAVDAWLDTQITQLRALGVINLTTTIVRPATPKEMDAMIEGVTYSNLHVNDQGGWRAGR